MWKRWWHTPAAKIYNFLGKDNVEFHTIIWPAELLGISGLYNEGNDTPISLPYDVPANEFMRSEEHTSELQSHSDLVCRLLLEKKKIHRRQPQSNTVISRARKSGQR